MSKHIYDKRYPYLVYIHTSKISGKSYIGYTSKSLKARFNGHLYDTKYGSTLAFHNALRKYGKENFVSDILYVCNSKEEACRAEIELIDVYCTYKNGYNETKGGDMPPGMLGRIGFDNPKSKQIIVDNILYPSIRAAVKSLKMDASTIYTYNKNPTGNILEYAESKRSIRPVIIDGIHYSSINDASNKLGIYIVRIREYVDKSLHLKFSNINEYYNTKRKSIPVTISGIDYTSKKDAMKCLGLTKYELNSLISRLSTAS